MTDETSNDRDEPRTSGESVFWPSKSNAGDLPGNDDTFPLGPRDRPGGPDSKFPEIYEQVEKLHETVMSRTWKAFNRERQTWVVIKEPTARILADDDLADRFRQEVRHASRLEHPNIVPIFETNLRKHPPFFTMPFVEGSHFDEFCKTMGLSIKDRVHPAFAGS
ncbi:MAG: hypothetical protein IH987_09480 [Planctomycetes bacterium]|nr:hypothetical protein [Planctomycetota bacterium]